MRATPGAEYLARQIDVGWSVFEAVDDQADFDPRGGIVAAVDHRPDRETGEIVRWFRTLRFLQGHPTLVDLSEHQINEEATGLPNGLSIRSAVRRLNELGGRRRGMLTSEELEWQEIALRLARSIG